MNDSFYVTGGTLPLDAGSYVTREADETLLTGLRQGRFCYVLDTRQMGKSSLMLRTARRLREEGCRVAVLDLTAVGQNLSVDQWYFGLLARVGAAYPKQSEALIAFWKTNREMGPMQRFVEALHQVLLTPADGDEISPLVLFLDEIDAVRSLPFSADELFGGIRECFNRRTQEPAFQKLTFCLLGVAAPTDLVQDTRLSPFNIGQRIELCDFTSEEAVPLVQGLTPEGGSEIRATRLLNRVLYWTDGHPYLTQRLCAVVAQSLGKEARGMGQDEKRVDTLCRQLFLTQTARETDDNLTFVRNRLLHSAIDVSTLLDFYLMLWRGTPVRDDPSNPLCWLLRLAGIASRRGMFLVVRNRVYRTVFDDRWVRENLPDAEVRRQKAAYRRGVMRTAGVSGAVVVCIGGLAAVAVQQTGVARRAEKRANEQEALVRTQLSRRYVEDAARLMSTGDYGAALAPLASAALVDQGDPARFAIHQQRFAAVSAFAPRVVQFWSTNGSLRWVTYSPDKRLIAGGGEDGQPAHLWDAVTGAELSLELPKSAQNMPKTDALPSSSWGAFSPDGTRLIACGSGSDAPLWNVRTRKLLADLPNAAQGKDGPRTSHVAWSQDGKWVSLARGEQVCVWDVTAGSSALVTPRLVMRDTSTRAMVNETAFMPGKPALAIGFENFVGAVLDIPTDTPRFILGLSTLHPAGTSYNTFHVAWNRDGSRLLVAGTFGGRGETRGVCLQEGRQTIGGHIAQAALPLLSHERDGTWADFSPDETRVATASDDGSARVWDARTGRPITPPLRHGRPVLRVAWSASGKRIVTAGTDNTARVWDAQTGEPICGPLHHAGAVVWAQFGRDDEHILTASRDGTVRVWELPHIASPFHFLHSGMELSRDGTRLIVNETGTRNDGKGQYNVSGCYDVATRRRLFPASNEVALFSKNSFDPDLTRRHIVWSADKGSGSVRNHHELRNVRVWDLQTGARVSPLLQADWANLSHDEEKLLLTDRSGLFRLVDLHTGIALIPPLQRGGESGASKDSHPFVLNYDPFTPDDAYLIIGSASDTLRFWDAKTGHPVGLPMRHAAPVYQLRCVPRGNLLFTCTTTGEVQAWHIPTGKPASDVLPFGDPFAGQYAWLRSMTISPDQRYAATTGPRGLYLWDLDRPAPLVPQKLPLTQTAHVVFSPDSRFFVATNQTAWLWRIGQHDPVSFDPAYTAKVTEAIFSPDSRRVLAIRDDGTALIWDTQTGLPLTVPFADDKLYSAAFNPDGASVLTGAADGRVRVWDAATGEPITPSFAMHGRAGVKFSPDGRSIVAQSGFSPDYESFVWNLPAPAGSVEAMRARAVLLSGERQDVRLGRIPVDSAALRAAWAMAGNRK